MYHDSKYRISNQYFNLLHIKLWRTFNFLINQEHLFGTRHSAEKVFQQSSNNRNLRNSLSEF